jgi:long-subunit acyl-CoA synthetase (AMP-forming)
MEEKLKEIGASKGKLLQSVSSWAKSLGSENIKAKQTNQPPTLQFELANLLILERIKGALGLDKCKGFLYGAAPIK